jgi:hypothetical protein
MTELQIAGRGPGFGLSLEVDGIEEKCDASHLKWACFRITPVSSAIRTRPQLGATKDTLEAKNRVGDGLPVNQAEV